MNKTIVLITIDTEFSTHKDDMGIVGRIGREDYGVAKLAQMLSQYHMKATWFIDVYTNKKQYLPQFVKICRELKDKGHDLQLHTHPNGLFDPKRGSMQDYSLDEQIEIIKRGKKIFAQWFGHEPIAHRAGDWGANHDTLKALQINGIKADSSMFYGWGNCQLNRAPLTQNAVVEYEHLLEVPASVLHCISLGMFSPFRLLSTDGNSFTETWAMLKKMQNYGIPVVTTVYHSFSFVKWNSDRTQYHVDYNRIKKFDRFLKALNQDPTIQVMTIKELYELYGGHVRGELSLRNKDFIPQSGLGATALRLMERISAGGNL